MTVFDIESEESKPIEFNVPFGGQFSEIVANPNISQLICFKNAENFCVINLKTFKVVRKGQGRFFWREFDEFLLITEGAISLFNIAENEPKLVYES